MEYRLLGNSSTKVSAICLGTMTWGEQNSSAEAFAQMDYAFEQGINFFDTAEMYPVPPSKQTYSTTEQIIGQWFEKRPGMREKIILATKIVGPSMPMGQYIRDGQLHFTKQNIVSALNESLKRLQTDFVDLYQLHWPDRSTNFFGQLGYTPAQDDPASVPLLETIEALADLVKEGKIRHIGVSNETPWGVMKALEAAKTLGVEPIVSIQNPYNLLNRTFEVGLAEIAHREKVGLLAYSPLAFGVLSGKYLNHAKPSGARLTLFDRFTRYSNPQAQAATQAYVNIASEAGLNPSQMALSYVTSRPFVTSNIIGATTLEQLEENIESMHLKLPESVLNAIEQVHIQYPNPSP